MTSTHDIFSGTIQKTDSWLKDIAACLGWDDPRGAYLALRATLHALRDRLIVDEAVQLGAQLPMLIRGLYYEGWKPSGKPLKERSREQFLAHIVHDFRQQPWPIEAESVARAVFKVLADRVTSGEIEDVRHLLPREIKELWPQPEQAAARSPAR